VGTGHAPGCAFRGAGGGRPGRGLTGTNRAKKSPP
jgi:hypothetical protein